MKLFKSVDEKLEAIGFKKIEESDLYVGYERYNEKYGYVQHLDLVNKISGRHIIQSYQEGHDSSGFDIMVGLTMYEAKLACKKMKQKGW